MKSVKIVMVGGGSVNWSPTIINDLTLTSSLQDAHYIIFDTNEEAGRKVAQLGEKLVRDRGLNAVFTYSNSEEEAFTAADFVIITISTGDLEAMEHDLKIPEDYRIYQTVGDTVGPGGWARGLRNIPVFVKLAKSIERYSPNAVVLNYTNPMAVLTKVFYKVSGLKTVGLCHGLFEVYDMLMKIFDLKSEEEIKVRFGGTNHFFWILEMKIRGEDGYALLKNKLQGRPFAELAASGYIDGAGFHSNKLVCSELFEHTGYLPYNGDRHTSEFLPSYLTGDIRMLDKYNLQRTSVEDRRKMKRDGIELLEQYISGKKVLTDQRSRETAADIIHSFVTGREFIDVVNLPNDGQIRNLPNGSIVETLGVINSLGFTPLTVGDLPESIVSWVLPHVRNQDMIVEAGLEGDWEKAFAALYNDGLCSHLSWTEIREMGTRLLEANKQYLPQFYPN